jgi:hypothetical protein
MNDLPCKTCIVLAVCKSRLSQLEISENNAYAIVVSLSKKCKLLYNYITPDSFYSYNLSHRHGAVLFLTGISLKHNDDIVLYPTVTDMEVNK